MARTGRPRVELDLEQAEKLGALHCTYSEASAFLNVPESTLKTRKDFSSAFEKGKEVGKISLRRIQLRLAQKSAAMAIFLGKNILGQKDDPLIDQSKHIQIVYGYRNNQQKANSQPVWRRQKQSVKQA